MIVSDSVVRLVYINPSRGHLIIQNLTDADLFILPLELPDTSEYLDNGICLKINGLFEDFGTIKDEFFGYSESECDVRIMDL